MTAREPALAADAATRPDGPALVLGEEVVGQVAHVIRMAAYATYGATLISGPEYTKKLHKWLGDIRPGDLVYELSTVWAKDRAADAVGYLERVAWEPISDIDPEFTWDEVEEGRPEPKWEVFYITTLDGRPYRWHNAKFLRVPNEAAPR
jgi:hypothetical protein